MPAYSMFLTEDCNLGCGYCALAAKQPGRITPEHGRQHIDFMFSRGDEQIDLCFFGTEVLLEQATLRELILYTEAWRDRLDARQRAGEHVVVPRVKLDLTTNGTLLREELIDFLEAHRVGITVSLDGTAEHQDAWRVTKNGKPTYGIIARHFERLVRYRPLVSIAMTVTPQSVASFATNVEHVYGLGFRKIDFSVTRDDPAWTAELFRVYAQQIQRVSDFYVARLAEGNNVFFGAFDSVIEEQADATRGNCGMGTSNLAVSTDGKIYPCWKFEGWDDAVIGTVETGVDPVRARPFTEFRYDNVLECRTCEYQRHCERCAWLNVTTTGDMYKRAENGCREKKATIGAALAAQGALRETQNPIYLGRIERLALEAIRQDHQKGFVVFKKSGKIYKVPAEVMAGFIKEDNPHGPTLRQARPRLADQDGSVLRQSATSLAVPRREIAPGGFVPLARLKAGSGTHS